MLDFPDSPTIGQTNPGPDGAMWRWDGAKWVNSVSPVSAGVASFNTRTGAVTLSNTDVVTVLPASSTTPIMDGTATIGVGTTWARSDHIHPSDTTRQTAAQVQAAVAPAFNAIGRNLIHNPLFNVAQRGAGPFTNPANTLDRWLFNATLDTFSVTQTALNDTARAQIGDEAPAFAYVTVFTGNAGATAFSFVSQRIEGVRRLAGKTITVSFWANAVSGSPKIGINLLQAFGTGGSPSGAGRVLSTGNAITLSTTWTRYSSTIAVPTIAGKTLGTNGDDFQAIEFWYSSGANFNATAGNIGVQSGSINIWGVQLEVGSVMTPLEKPDPADDLRRCQRFYFGTGNFNFQGYNLAGSPATAMVSMPAMRASPTVTYNPTSVGNITAGASNVSPMNNSGVLVAATPTVSGTFYYIGTFTASADL